MGEEVSRDAMGNEVPDLGIMRLARCHRDKAGKSDLGFNLSGIGPGDPFAVVSAHAGSAVILGGMYCPTSWMIPCDEHGLGGSVVDVQGAIAAGEGARDWVSEVFGFARGNVRVAAVSADGAGDYVSFDVNGVEYEAQDGRIRVVC